MVKTSTLAVILAALIISVVFTAEADGAGTVTTATEGELGWISVGTGTESGVKIDGETNHPGIKVIATQPTTPGAGDPET